MEILYNSLPTFLGAAIAFLFALFLYHLQRKTEQGLYLSYVVSMLVAQTNNLYSFKQSIGKGRKQEIEKLEGQFRKIPTGNTRFEIREISQFIANSQNFSLPINLEKLAFIADFDPNILVLLKVSLNASNDVDQLINTCNLEISRFRDGNNELHDIYMLVQLNKQLLEQIDYAITIIEKLQELLIDFSKLEYKNYVIVSRVDTLPEYNDLRPERTTTWHKMKYKNRKRLLRQRVFRILKRLFSC